MAKTPQVPALPGMTPLGLSERHVLTCTCQPCSDARAIKRGMQPCPTCKRLTLTTSEKARGYQCRACTASEEGVG